MKHWAHSFFHTEMKVMLILTKVKSKLNITWHFVGLRSGLTSTFHALLFNMW